MIDDVSLMETYVGGAEHPFALRAELDRYSWEGSRDGALRRGGCMLRWWCG